MIAIPIANSSIAIITSSIIIFNKKISSKLANIVIINFFEIHKENNFEANFKQRPMTIFKNALDFIPFLAFTIPFIIILVA